MYSPKFQTTVLLIIFSLSFSAGLECYYCDYIEGLTKNDDCKSKLRDEFVREVNPEPDFPSRSNNGTSKLLQALIDNKGPKGADAMQDMGEVAYCIKATGKQDGIEFISRGGAYAPPGLADNCQEVSEGGSGELCMCNTDRCNSARAIALNVGLMLVGATSALCKLRV